MHLRNPSETDGAWGSGSPCFSPLVVERDFCGRQSIGKREEQQDAYGFCILGEEEKERRLLLVVADGMGGYRGGREAAEAATQGFIDGFYAGWEGREEAVDAGWGEFLRSGLDEANGAVEKLVCSAPEKFENAGTTLLAVVIGRTEVQWISVGDSALFLCRRGQLRRLNADHSMRSVLAEKAKRGEMPVADLATHPERNMLLSALIGGEIAEVDAPEQAMALESGDILLGASDGVFTLDGEVMEQVLAAGANQTAQEIAASLLAKVNEANHLRQDNVTVTVIKI